MRLHILSDLHMEFAPVAIPRPDCDVVILAGDISTKWHGITWARRNFPDVPVIYVLGNHEYYGENFPSLVDKLRAHAQGSSIHVLENTSVTIDGITFFGATLWTDLALNSDWLSGAAEAGQSMNDYKRIRNSDVRYRRLFPRDTRTRHFLALQAMQEFFAAHDPRKTVVVTHHAPSPLSLPERRREKPLSCAYASRLEDFIARHQPLLWIHGHIHHHSDYLLGATRVLANPHAYPDEPNKQFIPDLVLTV